MDEDSLEIWAGLGFGGQFLLIFPAEDLVGVANSWNVFGKRVESVFRGLLDAMKAPALTR